MKSLKYFFQFIAIMFLFLIFRVLGLKFASFFSSKILAFIGPLFRSKHIIENNIKKSILNLQQKDVEKIINNMWKNYGRILSEYVFIKKFRKFNLKKNFIVEGQEILENIKKNKEPVIFISGHFSNFELMAMHIEKSGINLATVYRPLNNKYLNFIMEKIRKKYICKNQIKKGISGTKQLLSFFKNNVSIALMIDQRVSEGIRSNFFNRGAYTTTIPAQFVKKFGCKIVPIYIERIEGVKFKLSIFDPLIYAKDDSTEAITLRLNNIIEKMILKNPGQWIWSHNRWK